MTKNSKRRSDRRFAALVLCLLSPLAWGGPCDDVLERAEQAADVEEAQFILGGCLASRGPAHLQLQAAHALLLLADGDGLACRYAEILQLMLESELHELDSEVVMRITEDAERQACHCDCECLRPCETGDGDGPETIKGRY